MHEIITIQFGHRANYLGTHFWNTQESYFTYDGATPSPVDHDVHFRPGIGIDGVETFTPRALIYDLKGGFGSMKKINALYEMDEAENGGAAAQVLWDRGVTVQREPPIEQTEYQKNLDAGIPTAQLERSSVRYWSDFNRVFYHPRSSIQLSEYDLNSKILPFDGFGLGKDLFGQLNGEHDLLDRDFRLFAEECDQLQGVQLFTSTEDSWGGFASEYISALRDEYPKTGIVTWGLEESEIVAKNKQINRDVNLAYILSNIVPLTSLYIPLKCPLSNLPTSIDMDSTSEWHKSALLSVAMETCTLPTRLRDSTGAGRLGKLDDLASLLNTNGGQKIATLAMTLHVSSNHPISPATPKSPAGQLGVSWDSGGYGSSGMRIREGGRVKDRTFAMAGVVREPGGNRARDMEVPGSQPDAIIGRYLTSLTYPVIDSFPRIFPDKDREQDTVVGDQTSGLPVGTSLATSSGVIPRLKSIKNAVSQAIGVHEREPILNDLGEFIEAYEIGWNSGSDDDDD